MPLAPYHSPSLQKMEGGAGARRRKRFSCGNIAGDPFALATVSISILAWLLAFVASIISDISNTFPRWCWWTIAFMFFCIIGVTVVLGSDSVRSYHVAVVGYLSAGIVMCSSAVEQTIYSNQRASEAASAGFILLAIICIIWVFYFGSQPQASHRTYVDSFALHKEGRPSPRSSRQMSNRFDAPNTNSYAAARTPSIYPNNQLQGFETATPGFQNDTSNSRMSQAPRFGAPPQTDSQAFTSAPQSQAGTGPQADGSTVTAPDDYKYKARAIYSYEANPEDANEISFQKTEILQVSDVSGRWWQARKANGETGIAPSNYLILL